MKSRLLAISAGLATVLATGATACSDPNENTNVSAVLADTLTVWALTGTSPSFPSAYLASLGAVTRADGSFNFDIAFDIDASNNIVVYPQRRVGVPCIILTAAGQEVQHQRAMELGATEFLTKPFSPKKLYARTAELAGLGQDEHGAETA